MWYVWERGELHIELCWRKVKEIIWKGKGNNLQNPGVDGSVILDWILKKSVERAG